MNLKAVKEVMGSLGYVLASENEMNKQFRIAYDHKVFPLVIVGQLDKGSDEDVLEISIVVIADTIIPEKDLLAKVNELNKKIKFGRFTAVETRLHFEIANFLEDTKESFTKMLEVCQKTIQEVRKKEVDRGPLH